MAELALGLTKTVVKGALSRIQLAIEEEQKLNEGVQQDLEFITGEFQMMQSFLKVANKERARKNEVVRTWVRQLRDLAFEVEDWVEFVAHLEKDKSLCSSWWRWRLVSSWAVPQCLAPPRDLNEATAEMKLLKARVHDVSQRNTRYNLLSGDNSGSSSGLDSKAVMPAGSDLSSVAFQVLRQVWREETDRLSYVGNFKNLITHEVGGDDLQAIWLWEGDDRYASYDINMVYHDPEICQCFDRRAWVNITHPFKLEAFLSTLLAQLLFVGSSHQATNGLTSTELIQQVTKEQRYLIVLELVSDLVEWNTIRMYLPDNKKGSRIIVSTQNLKNAVLCRRMPYLVSELRCFPDDRPSLCAFYEKVAGRRVSDMDTLIWKLEPSHGVISVYGHGPRKSSVVKRLYLTMQQNAGKLHENGVTLRWVPVVYNGRRFSRRVLLPLDAYGFYDGGIEELCNIFGGIKLKCVLCMENEAELIERSRESLNNSKNCIVVIDGLRSREDWNKLRNSTILPADPTSLVIVVTHDERVARYCVDDNEDRLVHISGGGMCPIKTCTREFAIDWMRSISDPHLSKRRLSFDNLINDCMTVIRSRPVVSVWGIAGVGKSTLVNWSYTKKMLDPEDKHKFRYYCRVDVPHPFILSELSLRLLRAFFADYNSYGKESAMIGLIEGNRDPIQECRLLLRQHWEWLLVLDGLQSPDEWDSINDAFCLSQPTTGSKTIVVTNEQNVAIHCVDKNDKQVISVQALEADKARSLFNGKIFQYYNIDRRVSELLESIMAKSGGLPKVIDAVADHFNKVSNNKGAYLMLKDINDNFMDILEGSDNLRVLFSWMQSYLETCKDDLKPFIFYLTVFPIGRDIRIKRLLLRCIAEGYIREIREKNTERLFAELWEFSMLQVQQSSKSVKLNGFLHEYINSRPMEDNLVFAMEGSCNMQSQRAEGQHLTIRDSWDRDITVFESTDFSRLRSLTVFGECRPWMFDPAKIKMRFVRVLDLEDASGVRNDDLKHIVEVFPRLKFLSLRRCIEITRLPKSLGRLRQLQTLDVRHTSVATLPKAILKLQKLQFVHAGTIHSAPWDEGGIMAPYQAEARQGIIPTSVPVENGTTGSDSEDESTLSTTASDSEDTTIFETPPLSPAEVATTFAAAPSAPAEDASTPSATASDSEDTTIFETPPLSPAEVATTFAAAPSAPAEDASTPSATASDSEDTTIFETPPLSPAKVATTVAAALLAQTEEGKTVATAPLSPEEEATTGTPDSSALEEDSTIAVAYRTIPTQGTTILPVAPSAQVEDTIVVADLTALAEEATIVAATLSTPAEDTTSLAADPTAAVQDTIIVAPVPSTPAEDASTPSATGSDSEDTTIIETPPLSPTAQAEDSSTAAAAPRIRSHALVRSWLSKLCCRSQSRLDYTNHGVEVPAGIGKLTTLHTFGVANVGPGNNSVILKELHKLTQLCRLSVCSINLDNIRQFFSAITDLNHLTALSVRLDKNRDGLFPSLDDTIPPPPKTLDACLKLHGHVRILPGSWIKEFADVDTLDLEVTLQEQDDMQVILDHLIHRTNGSMKRLCIKPIQVGELRIGINNRWRLVGLRLEVLEIVCTTNLQATIGNIRAVDVLRVECSSVSSLQLSGLQAIQSLKEVWLKGSCSHALKEDLYHQLDQRRDKDKPVLKVLQTHSS